MIDVIRTRQQCASTVPVETPPEQSQSRQGPSGHNDDLPDMIPVRMLNEFTYCPRLGYLEWVEGEWAGNLETMEGSFGHRRVDRPSTRPVAKADNGEPKPEDANGPAKENDAAASPDRSKPIHTRSLMLSAPVEGLLAKLDLLELEGMVATPVDYKRGKVPSVPAGAYEPERVQLCAQGLILRANGFQCDRGVLYFIGSKKRITIEFTAELIQRTRQLRDDFRRTASTGVTPPPLVNSPKCPRCSLVGICLPDETNLLQRASTLHGENSLDMAESIAPFVSADEDEETRLGESGHIAEPRVRKLLPANDDALPLYVQTQGAMLGKSGDRLTIKLKDVFAKGDILLYVKVKCPRSPRNASCR